MMRHIRIHSLRTHSTTLKTFTDVFSIPFIHHIYDTFDDGAAIRHSFNNQHITTHNLYIHTLQFISLCGINSQKPGITLLCCVLPSSSSSFSFKLISILFKCVYTVVISGRAEHKLRGSLLPLSDASTQTHCRCGGQEAMRSQVKCRQQSDLFSR